jgi:hypothetical protein
MMPSVPPHIIRPDICWIENRAPFCGETVRLRLVAAMSGVADWYQLYAMLVAVLEEAAETYYSARGLRPASREGAGDVVHSAGRLSLGRKYHKARTTLLVHALN